MTATMTSVTRRVGLIAVAAVLFFGSLLGMFASWPVKCEPACASDDLHGSLFWTVAFGVPLAASVAAAALTAFGKLRVGAFVLGFAAVVLAVAILV